MKTPPARVVWPVTRFNSRGRTVVAMFFDTPESSGWNSSVDFIQHPERYGSSGDDLYQGIQQTVNA